MLQATHTSSPSHDQSQSPLFARLPLDIRRQIYLQLWLECGLTQHIYTFSNNSYLQSYPCILDANEWDRDPRPRAEESTSTGVSDDPAQQAQDGQPLADEQQPQPYDDPGDIDGAIMDIAPGPGGPTSTIDDEQPDTPWCHHKPCFERWIGKWDRSFSRAYSANYRGSSPLATENQRLRRDDRLRASPLLAVLLVCRRMYQEAGESLFSSMRFSFPLEALERFLEDVPRGLTERIQFVDIVTCTLLLYETPPRVQTVCKTLRDSFPNLRDRKSVV